MADLKITFHNIEPSGAVEARVREQVARLERLFPQLMGCEVVIEAAHRHQGTDAGYRVLVDLKVPGRELVASRETGHRRSAAPGSDIHAALRDAFGVAERRLQDHKQMSYRSARHQMA